MTRYTRVTKCEYTWDPLTKCVYLYREAREKSQFHLTRMMNLSQEEAKYTMEPMTNIFIVAEMSPDWLQVQSAMVQPGV